jgi:DNA repair exonuclease SbcCD ATPase subunit
MVTTMKKLTIKWQRLVDDVGQTCPRCGETGSFVENAHDKLKKALSELDVDVELIKEELDFATFKQDTLRSNRIWVGEKLLEEWVGGTVGKSRCCSVCGDSECRTLSTNGTTFETIPEDLIIVAGLLAAAELLLG